MAKLTLSDLENLQSEQSAVTTLEANNEAIEAALENTLSRDGTGPNYMQAPLDMNGYRILNVPAPAFATDVVRWTDVQNMVGFDYALVPNPAGHAGEVLMTDGNSFFWSDLDIPGGEEFLTREFNLIDVANVASARTNLGLGTAAVADTGNEGHAIPFLDGFNYWPNIQVFHDSSSLGTPGLGPDGDNTLGFRGTVPTIKNSNYTFQNDDLGKAFYHSDGNIYTWSIPNTADSTFNSNGQIIVLMNYGSADVTIAGPSAGQLRLVGTGQAGNRQLKPHGLATLYKVIGDLWYISGTGVV